jgi:hypothetical protein
VKILATLLKTDAGSASVNAFDVATQGATTLASRRRERWRPRVGGYRFSIAF